MNPADCVLINAVNFDHLGGWVVDQQFMDVIGASFLLAHGMGTPVAPATTEISIPQPGHYRIWVRTRDWVTPHGPGRFRLHINDLPLLTEFGHGGDGTWQWWDGGLIEMQQGIVRLTMEDLTGFDGRCDAILFVRNGSVDDPPPNTGTQMQTFRDTCSGHTITVTDAGIFDFIVAGGGYAGICAAISAARLGLKVALIHDRPVLGGNASSEVRVNPVGSIVFDKFPQTADIVKELHRTPRGMNGSGGIRACPDDEYVNEMVTRETGISLFLNMHVFDVELDGNEITAILARHTRNRKKIRFSANIFADCTGDAQIGFLAGADWRLGREGQHETGESLAPQQGDTRQLGVSNFWFADYTDNTTTFPTCPWTLPIHNSDNFEVSPPRWPPQFGTHAYAAGWNWESGFDMDQLLNGEYIRDHNFRAIYGVWDYLKNRHSKRAEYEKAKLSWVGYIMGRRESRRLLGDIILTQHDLCEPRLYPDGCVTTTWYLDLHFPHPLNSLYFPGCEFRSIAFDDPNFEQFRGEITGCYTEIAPYPIPFRCLYSRNITNLFMAGRNISVTHVALATVRTMNTTAKTGTVIGRAAFLCRKLHIKPRELYINHLQTFLDLLQTNSSEK